MSTWVAACGCSVTASMFGEHEAHEVHMCPTHAKMVVQGSRALSAALHVAHEARPPQDVRAEMDRVYEENRLKRQQWYKDHGIT